MSYLKHLAPCSLTRDEARGIAWETLHSQDIRDWSSILRLFPWELSSYIKNIYSESTDYPSAREELDALRSALVWEESYFLDWELEVYTPPAFESVEYASLDEALAAEEEGIEPEICPTSAWEDQVCMPEISWGSPSSVDIRVNNLRLKIAS